MIVLCFFDRVSFWADVSSGVEEGFRAPLPTVSLGTTQPSWGWSRVNRFASRNMVRGSG